MKEKQVKIGDIEFWVRASAATPIKFNEEFKGEDFFKIMANLEKIYKQGEYEQLYEVVEDIQKITYVFAKHYATFHQQPFVESFVDWLEQFETFELAGGALDIFDLWLGETKTVSTAKKKAAKQSGK